MADEPENLTLKLLREMRAEHRAFGGLRVPPGDDIFVYTHVGPPIIALLIVATVLLEHILDQKWHDSKLSDARLFRILRSSSPIFLERETCHLGASGRRVAAGPWQTAPTGLPAARADTRSDFLRQFTKRL